MDVPVLFLIRHGEKPPKQSDGDDAPGLSELGLMRAQGLVQVFGQGSQYNIGYIIAEKPKEDGSRARPYLTIKPLAASLGIAPNIDINRDDADDVAEAALKYKGPGNVLICWEHGQLTKIAKAIGVKHAPEYPGDRFDIIWTISNPYHKIDSETSENVPGLDGAHNTGGEAGVLPAEQTN